MSSYAIACPQCRATLRSSRPLPEKKKVRCPQCGISFTTPAALTATVSVVPPPSDSVRARIIASLAGTFLLGSAVVTGLYATRPGMAPIPVAKEPKETNAKNDKAKRQADEDRLAEQRRQLDEQRRQLEEEKKHLAFARLMHKADEALAKKEYANAEKVYREALKTYPDDADAKNGVNAAKSSRLTAEAAMARAKEEKEKRQAEIARLLEQGKEAMDKKDFAAALRAYTKAQQLAPEDAHVSKALEEALAAVDADADEKKKLTENPRRRDDDRETALAAYQRFMKQAALDMENRRYPDALVNFQEALRIKPDDADALQGLADVRAAVAKLVRQRAQYEALMLHAAAAVRQFQHDEAIRIYEQVLQQMPNDPQATQALKQAKYDRALTRGRLALAANRPREAIDYFEEALQIAPDDPAARALLNQARLRQR